MALFEKLRSARKRLTNFSNNPLLSVPLDTLSNMFPVKGVDENAQRSVDRAKAQAGDLGDRIEKTPALVNGHLNRDKILIGTAAFYSDDNFTEDDVKRISDGGFDFLITADSGEFTERLLDDCEKYKLAVIAKDNSLPGGPEIIDADLDSDTLFADYRKHPVQVGDMGWDESKVTDFPFIGRFYERYHAALPEQFLFNNLFPGCATKGQTGGRSYRDYIERFSAAVPSDYISTDIYPFHPLAVMNKVSMLLCLHTYHTVGDVCRRDNKDFWLYLQTQGNWFSHIYALPTYELIKWQCWAALCYGARSLIHVAYTPVWDKDAYAMLDKRGNLTEQYIYAKRINAEIQQLSDILKNYRSLGVLPTKANKENPHFFLAVEGQRRNNDKQGFSGISAVSDIRSESTALSGYFENPSTGENALMLVNCKSLYDANAIQKIRITFAYPVKVKVYAHGKLKMSSHIQSRLEVKIGSCDGVFIEINRA